MHRQLRFFRIETSALPLLLFAFGSYTAQAEPANLQPPAASSTSAAAPSTPASAQDAAFVPPRAIPSSVMTNWPVYTEAARRAHREGVVLLSVTISADGTPLDVKVLRSSNFADLDVAAVIAVHKWKFTPATLNGVASETTVNLPVNFSLKTAEKTPEPVAAASASPATAPKQAPVKPKPKAAKIAPKPKPPAVNPKASPPPSKEAAPAEPE